MPARPSAKRSARSAKKKKRGDSDVTLETLDELESIGDRLAAWAGENPLLVLGSACAILLVAGIWGFTTQHIRSQREAAAGALAQVDSDYRGAMGGNPGAFEVPEPANPEIAQSVREEFSQKYQAVAEQYSGQAAAVLALLDAGSLEVALGNADRALELDQQALAEAKRDSPVRALVLARLAGVHEQAGRWHEAAEAFAQAGAIEAYPLHWDALADAARCHAEAGEAAEALALYRRITSEAGNYRLPPYLEERLRELEASGGGVPEPSAQAS